MADLIDRAALINRFERIAGRMKCETFHISLIETEIKEAPNLTPGVDVAVVIRCKNCKHRYHNEDCGKYCCDLWGDGYDTVVQENDYCSYGERRADG